MFPTHRHRRTYASRKNRSTLNRKDILLTARESIFDALSLDNIRKKKNEQTTSCSNKFLPLIDQNNETHTQSCRKKKVSESNQFVVTPDTSTKIINITPDVSIHVKRNSLDAFDRLLMRRSKTEKELIKINTSDLEPSMIAKINVSSDESSANPDSPLAQISSDSENQNIKDKLSNKKVRKKIRTKKKYAKTVFANITNKNESTYNHVLEIQNVKTKSLAKSNSLNVQSLLQSSNFKKFFQVSNNDLGSSCNKLQSSNMTDNDVQLKNISNKFITSPNSNEQCVTFSSTPFKINVSRLKVIENFSPISITDSQYSSKQNSIQSLNTEQKEVDFKGNSSNHISIKRLTDDISVNSNKVVTEVPNSSFKSQYYTINNSNSYKTNSIENLSNMAVEVSPTKNIEQKQSLMSILKGTSHCDNITYPNPVDNTLFNEPYLIGFTSQAPINLSSKRTEVSSPDMFDSVYDLQKKYISFVSTEESSVTESDCRNLFLNESSNSLSKSKLNSTGDHAINTKDDSVNNVIVISNYDENNDSTNEITALNNNYNENLASIILKNIYVNQETNHLNCNTKRENTIIEDNFVNNITSISNNITSSVDSAADSKSETFPLSEASKENVSIENSTSDVDIINDFSLYTKELNHEECNSFENAEILTPAIISPSCFVTRRKRTNMDSNITETLDSSGDHSFFSYKISDFDLKNIPINEHKNDSHCNDNDNSFKNNEVDIEDEVVEQLCELDLNNKSNLDNGSMNIKTRRRSSICLRNRRIICNNNKNLTKTTKAIHKSAKKKSEGSRVKQTSNILNSSFKNPGTDHCFVAPKAIPKTKRIQNMSEETISTNIINNTLASDETIYESRPSFVLQPGKRWERSLSIMKKMAVSNSTFMSGNSFIERDTSPNKGRKCRESIFNVLMMQNKRDSHWTDVPGKMDTTLRQSLKPISTSRRLTIRIVQVDKETVTDIEDFTTLMPGDNTGFLSDTCNDTLINNSSLSISPSGGFNHSLTKNRLFDDTVRTRLTAKDVVLRRCDQDFPLPFDEYFPEDSLKHCRKIGEGVYGEVFMYRPSSDENGVHAPPRVMKVIPVEGNLIVNGEHQKKFDEILSEIVIAMELSALRSPKCSNFNNKKEGLAIDSIADLKRSQCLLLENCTDVFNRVESVRCVLGAYPRRLLDLWDLYDETKGSENDSPICFSDNQLYIVLELENGGEDLEAFIFNNAEQACSVFDQVALSLAIAEEVYQFEHRDLHWGNILVSATDNKVGEYTLSGEVYSVPLCGVKATIIDYTLSRLTLPATGNSSIQTTFFNDLSADDELFDATGDYQFEIYRLMKKKNSNCWKNFEPYSNILWLHYTLDKMITALRYRKTNTNAHKHSIGKLTETKESILQFGSTAQFVAINYEKFVK